MLPFILYYCSFCGISNSNALRVYGLSSVRLFTRYRKVRFEVCNDALGPSRREGVGTLGGKRLSGWGCAMQMFMGG